MTIQITPAILPARNLPVEMIRYFVMVAMNEARRNPDEQYTVVPKGWGHPARIIAPMFDHAPINVGLPFEFIY